MRARVVVNLSLLKILYVDLRIIFQLYHVHPLSCGQVLLVKADIVVVHGRYLVNSRRQLAECQLIIFIIVALTASVPMQQLYPTSFIRNGRSCLCDGLIAAHHTNRILHVAVEVAQAAKLVIRISILRRPVHHGFYVQCRQRVLLVQVESVAVNYWLLRTDLCFLLRAGWHAIHRNCSILACTCFRLFIPCFPMLSFLIWHLALSLFN